MAELKRLTDLKIRSCVTKGQTGLYADGEGLYLRVTGKGAASWIFRSKHKGKLYVRGIGSLKKRGLADARDKARLMHEALANGFDPGTVVEQEAKTEKPKTFGEYASEYIDAHKTGWRHPKHRQQWNNTIRDYVNPVIGDKIPRDITNGDIEKMLVKDGLWATKTETATRIRQRVERIIDYAFVKEGIERLNPARWKGNLAITMLNPIKAAKANNKLKHHAAPSWKDVPSIMDKLRRKPEVVSALAMRFSILTAARSMEVRNAEWHEFDLENAVWTLPGHRAKNGETHLIPLNTEALDILATMQGKKRVDSKRVFPGPKGGLLSDVAVSKVLKAAMPGITAHGISRSSFRDWVADETGYSDKVAEAALNHKNPNETEASYLRTKFYDKRIELMKDWGKFLNGETKVASLSIVA